MKLEDAKKEWGSRLTVAALAAILKGDDSWRVGHGGTHGVKVNPGTVFRDQCRNPSVAGQRAIMVIGRDNPGSRFLPKGGVSKAHRRVRVCRRT